MMLNVDIVFPDLLSHLSEAYPNEGCGFLLGTSDEEGRQVTEIMAVANAKAGDQRRRFEIAPLDYMRAEKYALAHDLELLGVYHSHPNHPAEPSEHDRVQAFQGFSYIIVSVQKSIPTKITSWQLNSSGFFEAEPISPIAFSLPQYSSFKN